MTDAAYEQGLLSLGFSGHAPMDYPSVWGMAEDDVPLYIDAVSKEKRRMAGKMEIFCGVELDMRHTLKDLDRFDYIIGAVHSLQFGGRIYEVDDSFSVMRECIDREFGGDGIKMADLYFSLYGEFLSDLKPDVIAHYDLIEKFNESGELFDHDSARYRSMVASHLKALLESCPDSIFEVNTGAMFRVKKKSPYPMEFILDILRRHDRELTISSDAHQTSALSFVFDETRSLLKDKGFDHISVLHGGQWVREPLS